METKALQKMERQMKTLTQDFRRLRVVLNAHLAFASLHSGVSPDNGSWTQRELEGSLQQLDEDLQAFAQLVFAEKADGVDHAAA